MLIGGGLITTAATHMADKASDRFAGQVMDRYADDVGTAVNESVQRYGEILTDLAFGVAAHPDLRRIDFLRMTSAFSAERLPGAAGVTFVVPATTAQMPAVQRFWRARGADGLKLRPAVGTGEHEFVIFDRQVTPGANLDGIDVQGTAPAAAVLRAARHSGEVAISPAYQLLRDRQLPATEQQTSVVLAVPVLSGSGDARAEVFRGWLTMGLHGQDFLTHTLSARTHDAVNVELTDPAVANTTIARSAAADRVDHPSLTRQRTIVVGQRRWHLTLQPTSRLIATADRGTVRLTAIAGAGLTVLLSVIVALLVGSRNRALRQVDRATTALRADIDRRTHVETQLREREQQLQHLAFHDPLTGLANRLLFHNRVNHALETVTVDHTFAVLFIDLDGFKPINDNFGHEAGDLVLQTTATRLHHVIRAGDTAARLGGDEFAVLVTDLSDATDARATAERILAVVERPIDISDAAVRVTASIGIAVHRHGTAVRETLHCADAAMYAAKASGKARSVLASTGN